MKNWSLIYTTTNASEASILQGMLQQNNIEAMVMNKQDSSYLNFGEIEIYVPFHLKDIAKNLIDNALMN
jgi:hypothetical protein